MSRRVAHRWLTWLLPLLALRAFVPAGFMLGASGDDLQLMLCSGTAAIATQNHASPDGTSHAHHAEQNSTHDHGGGKVHENSICPFAAASSAGVPMPASAPVAFMFEPLEHFAFFADPELRSAPVLIDRIRGPPVV